jgi:hypothetical protein
VEYKFKPVSTKNAVIFISGQLEKQMGQQEEWILTWGFVGASRIMVPLRKQGS